MSVRMFTFLANFVSFVAVVVAVAVDFSFIFSCMCTHYTFMVAIV